MQIQLKTCLILAALGLGITIQAQGQPKDQLRTAHSFERPVTLRANYAVLLPQGYEGSTDKRWPLILFLHGAGERGTNLSKVDVHGPVKYVPEHPDFPFILVSPQCPEDQTWSNDVLLELLREVSGSYKVDSQRVYLTGLSMGGFGTWGLALAHPEKFAAVAPICGGGEVLEVLLAKLGMASPARKEALKSLPIWAFHGAQDTAVPLVESERMVQALRQFGATEIKLTVYPEANHDAWTQTYSNPEFYNWLLAHHR